MWPIRIALISDVHAGPLARTTDLDPTSEPKIRDVGYLASFSKMLRDRKIEADYLVLAGDLTSAAAVSEFNAAYASIDNIRKWLNVTKRKTIVVPGNHDVNWDVLKIGTNADKDTWKRARYVPMTGDATRKLPRITAGAKGSLVDPPYFCHWSDGRTIIFGYNSAWHDGPDGKPHHGMFDTDHKPAIESELAKLGAPDDRLRMFVVHHHPLQYSDPVPHKPDFSAMTNANALLALLNRHRFDVMIHGHKHVPNMNFLTMNQVWPLVVVGAGSFSAELPNDWGGLVSNQFHLLTVVDRATGTGSVRGTVKSWAYLAGHGWVPSGAANGAPHEWSFGSKITKDDAIALLVKHASGPIDKTGYWDCSSYVASDLELQYFPSHVMIEVVDAACATLGISRAGNLSTNDCVLYRRAAGAKA